MWSSEALQTGGAWELTALGRRYAPLVLAVSFMIASATTASAQTWRDLLQKVQDEQTQDPAAAEVVATEDPAPPDDAAAPSEGQSADRIAPGHTVSETSAQPVESSSRDDDASPAGERSLAEEPVAATPLPPIPGRPIPDPADLCYQELASIGADSSFLESPEFHFKHVFQYIDTPPYYRYVGPASIGIKREPKSAPMYQIHEGRPLVGEDHYALLTPMGKGAVADVVVDIGLNRGQFAHLFFDDSLPAEPHNGTGILRSRFGQIRVARVATTVGDDVVVFRPSLEFHSHSFYEVERGTTWRRAESEQDRWLGERRYFRTPDNVNYVRADSDTVVRTISPARETTTRIAGVERTQRIFCRYANTPLAVTNHDAFLPAIERELESWVENVIGQLQHEPVIEIPKGHVGDFVHRDGHGTIAIRWESRIVHLNVRRNRQYRDKEITFGVRARLDVHGEDFGVVSEYSLGTGTTANYGSNAIHTERADRIEERFERGGFPIDRLHTPGGEVPVRFRCTDTTCVLEAQRWYLASVGRL